VYHTIRRNFLITMLVLSIIAIVGCTTTRPSDEGNVVQTQSLADAIEEQINQPRYLVYIDVSQASAEDGTLVLRYSSYQATAKNAILNQMLAVIQISLNYTRENNISYDSIDIQAMDRSSTVYSLSLTRQEAETADFNILLNKTTVVTA